MPSQKSFGRRATSHAAVATGPRRVAEQAVVPMVGADTLSSATAADSEQSVDVDRELEEWKAARKSQRRSFREPWRTLTIAATVGFGLSSWLLPDSVADVAELVTGGLGAASFFAGFRIRPPVQKLSAGLGE